MADFKVIYRVDTTQEINDEITWEPGCPLLFEAIQVSRNTETGQAFLQGKLRNISDQLVQSFKALITVEYEDGNTEFVEFNPLDADILDGTVYKLDPASLKQGDVSKALGTVESIKLADGKWESTATPTDIPAPQLIGLSEEAVPERYERIWKPLKGTIPFHERKGFAGNHLDEYDGWWLCPCGQVNANRGSCVRCGASLEDMQNPDAENEEALKAAFKNRQARDAQKSRSRRKEESEENTHCGARIRNSDRAHYHWCVCFSFLAKLKVRRRNIRL